MKQGLNPIPRKYLNGNTEHYETTWIEIENTKGKNILICCANRHPNLDPEILQITCRFSNDTVTNKQVFVLEDFNINLLNYDSNTPSGNFVNLFLSQHFLSYIVHPTRVSDQSATVTDNIFKHLQR